MTSLKEALEAQGFKAPSDEGAASGAVVDVAAIANVDLSGIGNQAADNAKQEDDLAIPPFLKSGAPPPVSSALGDLGQAPVEVQPGTINTVVPVPVTPEVTAPAPANGGADTSNQPTNVAADRRAVLRAITAFGEQEGFGANARAAFFEKVADAARLGALSEADAELVQSRYGEGMAKAKGIAQVKMPSETQQRSKIKTMIKLGALPGIRADVLIAETKDRIKAARDAGNAPKKSPADIYLSVARMQLGQPQYQLTPDQIDMAMASKTPDPKVEADLLYNVASVADKLLAEDAATPLSDESKAMLTPMIQELVKRVTELGGTTQMQKDAEKARIAAEKAAKKAAAAANAQPGSKLRNLGSSFSIPMGAARYRG